MYEIVMDCVPAGIGIGHYCLY